MLLSEHILPTPQREPAMDRLLGSLEDHSANTEQQAVDDRDGMAPVPKVARLLQDGQGKFMYIGDSASLSFLQSVRRIVSASIGRCEFTEDNSRHSMLEAFQNSSTSQSVSLVPPPCQDEAQRLAQQYVLATSPLLDLFDLDEFYSRLVDWVDNPSGDEDTVSSIFYLVMAIGAQTSDINQTSAEQYFVSGRQLAFSAFTETPSIYTIQSYVLISMYMLGACRRNGAFMNLGIALRAAYAVGIHRRDANALFCARERRAREHVWRSLRMMDLFLSASLGRPPATSDFDHDSTVATEPPQLSPEEQLSTTVVSLCHIFERILTEVYMKQVVSLRVADTISNQHRTWVRNLPSFLQIDSQRLDDAQQTGGNTLAAAHILGTYYWSIILLTRPFLIFRVSHHVHSNRESPSTTEAQTSSSTSRIALFADACVYSALRCLDLVDGLHSHHAPLPRRLPFLINSVFNAAVVLGAAFFADYDNLLPLEDGLNKAERFLELFVPHDPHACRFSQIIKYLRAAVTAYIRQRNRHWIDRRSKQVDQLFGQIGSAKDQPATVDLPVPNPPSPPGDIPSGAPTQQPGAPNATFTPTPSAPTNPPEHEHDIWSTLYNSNDLTTLPHDATISTLTTTGIPVGCFPENDVPGAAERTSQTPLSDMILSDNGLFYSAEDVHVFGLWGES